MSAVLASLSRVLPWIRSRWRRMDGSRLTSCATTRKLARKRCGWRTPSRDSSRNTCPKLRQLASRLTSLIAQTTRRYTSPLRPCLSQSLTRTTSFRQIRDSLFLTCRTMRLCFLVSSTARSHSSTSGRWMSSLIRTRKSSLRICAPSKLWRRAMMPTSLRLKR